MGSSKESMRDFYGFRSLINNVDAVIFQDLHGFLQVLGLEYHHRRLIFRITKE